MEPLLKWKRFIVKNGASFYLAMPLEWIRTLQLQKDDQVDIELNQDGSLTLRPIPAEVSNE